MLVKKSILSVLLAFTVLLLLSSCSQMGWGVLLWSIEEPPIPSGSMLPVYIKSNIDQVWVVGVPESLVDENNAGKVEVPLTQFEFAGNKKKAEKRAKDFSQYAHIYAENLQDGLPIRDNPDNNSRRVYRMRPGEIIKVLSKVDGIPPISTTGDPLPGDWYKVLTNDGVTGYCFSYRLKLFDHYAGPLQSAPVMGNETVFDPDLDMAMAKKWSPELYLQMINSRRINTDELRKHYRFDPGQDTGIARIILPDIERDFPYEKITADGERAWRFEGSSLQMSLRTNTTLAVQYTENTGLRRTLVFVSLSADVDDLILQENARREEQFLEIYNQGPIFTSNNYGTIVFTQTGGFVWSGFDILVPQLISSEANTEGQVLMDIFVAPSFIELYTGAVTFRFTGGQDTIRFMYNLDNQGMRLEVVPEYAVEDVTVTRRSSSPVVLYFFKDSQY